MRIVTSLYGAPACDQPAPSQPAGQVDYPAVARTSPIQAGTTTSSEELPPGFPMGQGQPLRAHNGVKVHLDIAGILNAISGS